MRITSPDSEPSQHTCNENPQPLSDRTDRPESLHVLATAQQTLGEAGEDVSVCGGHRVGWAGTVRGWGWLTSHLEQVYELLHRTSSWRRNVSLLSYTFDCWPHHYCQSLHHPILTSSETSAACCRDWLQCSYWSQYNHLDGLIVLRKDMTNITPFILLRHRSLLFLALSDSWTICQFSARELCNFLPSAISIATLFFILV